MSDILSSGETRPYSGRAISSSEVRRDINKPAGDNAFSAGAQDTVVSRNSGNIETGTQPDFSQKDKDPLERAAEAIQSLMPEEERANTQLQIDKDEASGKFIYKTVDRDSGEVVRQIPVESVLKVLNNYRDVEGIAIDDIA